MLFRSKIAVANTFTRIKEMQPYIDLAKRYGYRVHVITVEKNHDGDNEHEVPDDAINKMATRWQWIDSRMRKP